MALCPMEEQAALPSSLAMAAGSVVASVVHVMPLDGTVCQGV